LDLAAYQDVTFYIDVREYSGTTPSIQFQTAPIKDEILFSGMLSSPMALNSITTPSHVAITTSACPVARFVRWQLTGPASTWDATFRVLVSAGALGL
jgi:hypothetical protein